MNVLKHNFWPFLALLIFLCANFTLSFGQTNCSPCITTIIEPECPNAFPLDLINYAAETDEEEDCQITWTITNGLLRHNGVLATTIGPVPFDEATNIGVRWDDTSEPGTLSITVSNCEDTTSNGTHQRTIPIISLTGQDLPGLQTLAPFGYDVPYCVTDFDVRVGSGQSTIFVGNNQSPTAGTGEEPEFYDWLVPAGWTVDGIQSDGVNRISTQDEIAAIGTFNGCTTGQILVRARYTDCALLTTTSNDQVANLTRAPSGGIYVNKSTVKCGSTESVSVWVNGINCANSFDITQVPAGWTYLTAGSGSNYAYGVYRSNGINGGTFKIRANLNCGNSFEHEISVGVSTPSLHPISGPESICTNGTFTFSVPSDGFADAAFTWSVSPNLQIVGANVGPTVDVKPKSVSGDNGPGWVKVSTCSNQSNQKDVHVGVPLPISISAQVDPSSPGASFPFDELCYWQDNYVTASYPFSVNSFSWSLATGSGSAMVQAVDNQTALVRPYSFNTVKLSVTATNSCGTSQPITHDFDVKSCGSFFNGGQEPKLSPTLSVSPNPASDILHISLAQDATEAGLYAGETELILYNSNQIEVKRSKTSDLQTQFDVKDLDPGLYFLKVFRGKEVEVKKILISRK